MSELFVGAVDFRSDGLDEPFEGQVYCLSTDEGLAEHTIYDSNTLLTPTSWRAAGKVLDLLDEDDEDAVKQLYGAINELEGHEPWSEAIEGGLADRPVTFDREYAEEADLLQNEDELRTGLHSYLVRQHHIYRPYSLKTEAYHAGKLPDWQEPEDETGLLDQYVDYEISGLDEADKLPERMQFLAAVKRRLEKGEREGV